MRRLLAAALLLASCNTGFDPQFRVKDVRVLAVRSRALPLASPPLADVSPGDTVSLEVLAVNPQNRPGFTITWFACLPGADEARLPCQDPALLQDAARLHAAAAGPNPQLLTLGTGPTITFTVPPATDPAMKAAMDFVIANARRQKTFECRLYGDAVVIVLAEAGGRFSIALKTVRVKPSAIPPDVTDHYTPVNSDPMALEVRRAPADPDSCTGGASLGSAPFPAGRTVVCGVAAGVSQEPYTICDPDGSHPSTTESLVWQWYVTDGDFPDEGGIGNARGDHLDFVRPPGPFTLWAILRDGRGGEDWVTYDVTTAP